MTAFAEVPAAGRWRRVQDALAPGVAGCEGEAAARVRVLAAFNLGAAAAGALLFGISHLNGAPDSAGRRIAISCLAALWLNAGALRLRARAERAALVAVMALLVVSLGTTLGGNGVRSHMIIGLPISIAAAGYFLGRAGVYRVTAAGLVGLTALLLWQQSGGITLSYTPPLISEYIAASAGSGLVALLWLSTQGFHQRTQQELVRARDAAEAASRAKSAFLASMSHELRTPMNGILGCAQLLELSRLDPAQRELLAPLRESAQGLLAKLDDVLAYSRLEQAPAPAERRPFLARPVLEEAFAAAETAARAKGLAARREIEVPDAPLIGDRAALRQLLAYLLDNAVRFTPRGAVELRATWRAGALEIAIRDTGVGIPAEAQQRIFLPFEQVDASHARPFDGTGLGLAIAHRLALGMNAEIRVESEVGQGSTFTLALPAPEAEAAA